MIFFWGSTTKQKVIEQGEFYCPGCRATSDYALLRVSEYFTFYFIPLFKTGTLGEYVECRHCGGEYSPEVLEMSAEEVEAMVRPWRCPACDNSNPAGEDSCVRCGERRREARSRGGSR